jgi:hypothetical protein
VLLEVEMGDWRSIGKGEINLDGSLIDSLVGHENSPVAMRKRYGWPEGSDDEVLLVILGGPR